MKEVAHEMGISFGTAQCHLTNAYSRLGVHNVAELALKFEPARRISSPDLKKRTGPGALKLGSTSEQDG